MNDQIDRIGNNSLIQHGEHNKRVYLMKLDPADVDKITSLLTGLARGYGYTKIFCKVPDWAAPRFFADGYVMEGMVPGFYAGTATACFMSKFLNSDRLLGMEDQQMKDYSKLLEEYAGIKVQSEGPEGLSDIERLTANDAEEITSVFKEVFISYPFPIHDPEYIRKTMNENIIYFGMKKGGKLIAVSSAEIDFEGRNVEMTDFATLPEARGRGMAGTLLQKMEYEMNEEGILTFYTIARLNSFPMNRTFLRRGYQYAGTLINNTNIAGDIESMNVLYKQNYERTNNRESA